MIVLHISAGFCTNILYADCSILFVFICLFYIYFISAICRDKWHCGLQNTSEVIDRQTDRGRIAVNKAVCKASNNNMFTVYLQLFDAMHHLCRTVMWLLLDVKSHIGWDRLSWTSALCHQSVWQPESTIHFAGRHFCCLSGRPVIVEGVMFSCCRIFLFSLLVF